MRFLENGLRAFRGVPLLPNLDNLKAAVLKADWFDPGIDTKLADFCRHYGLHVMPCRPYNPQHKGKVERGVGYVRANALKGTAVQVTEPRELLCHAMRDPSKGVPADAESQVADKRIHGTKRKQVAICFEGERA